MNTKATKFFNDLYVKHYNDVLTNIVFRINNYHTAEDLTQDTFAKIAKNTGDTLGYDSTKGASIKTWIFNYANNTVYDYYRTEKESRYSFVGDNLNENGSEIISKYVNIFEDEDMKVVYKRKMIRKVIHTSPELNEKDRKIALMYWVMGLKTKEIKEVLEIPMGTVNVTMKRIKTKLAYLNVAM
jgi:RNA polymerase sigma-70 factor (ECF subfamily)